MNISKAKLVLKFLFGGREAVLDYVLECANALVAKLPEAKKEDIKGYFKAADKIAETLDNLAWLCPKKWYAAYADTLDACAGLVSALADLEVTKEELAQVSAAFQKAYASWCGSDGEKQADAGQAQDAQESAEETK